jgi:hypothetical protein
MKWLVRISAGVLIAFLGLTMFRVGGYARANIFAIAAILYCVGRFEGLEMNNFWGDDDDDGQGPLKPT